ncbi:MAG TPA: HD domain-containing protein [Verrucomicrobiae bacterium]|nr:HD domain-containing protein [Verrucomicrobiae bacterium]
MFTALEDFRPSAAMRAEVRGFMDQREPEPEHVQHVRELALSLFDQLKERHGLGEGARFLLESAALLHDIGWSVAPDGRKHHKVAYDMIRSHRWAALPATLVPIIALVARYHRKSVPDAAHDGFAELDSAEQAIVRKLAALLRVADALDRSHQSRVLAIAAKDTGAKVVLRLSSAGPCAAELAAADAKKDLFEMAYGVPLVLLAPGI